MTGSDEAIVEVFGGEQFKAGVCHSSGRYRTVEALADPQLLQHRGDHTSIVDVPKTGWIGRSAGLSPIFAASGGGCVR